MKKKVMIISLIAVIIILLGTGILFKNKIILYLQRHQVIAYNYDVNTDRIPILTFHSVVPDEDKDKYYKDNYAVVSESFFNEILKYLKDNNYKTLSLDEFYEWYKGNIEYDKRTVVLTFDDARIDNYYYAIPKLKEYDMKATIFVIGSFTKDISKKYEPGHFSYFGKDVIKDIKDNYPNIDLQSHSYALHKRDKEHFHIDELTKEELLEDFKKMKEEYNFDYMAYPFGKLNDIAKEAAKESGYKLVFAYKPYDYARRTDDPYAINRIKIKSSYTLYEVKRWLIF